MAKKFGKFMLFSAVAGAAAAGIYYYLQKNASSTSLDDDSDDEDFDDFDDDLDNNDMAEALKVNSEDSATSTHNGRTYVSLNLDDNKESPAKNVAENAEEFTSDIGDLEYEEAPETVEEFFDDDDNSSDMT